MRAKHHKAAGPHRRQAFERMGDPIGVRQSGLLQHQVGRLRGDRSGDDRGRVGVGDQRLQPPHTPIELLGGDRQQRQKFIGR